MIKFILVTSVHAFVCQTTNREEKHWIVVPVASQGLISRGKTLSHSYSHLLCFLHFYLSLLYQGIKIFYLMFMVFWNWSPSTSSEIQPLHFCYSVFSLSQLCSNPFSKVNPKDLHVKNSSLLWVPWRVYSSKFSKGYSLENLLDAFRTWWNFSAVSLSSKSSKCLINACWCWGVSVHSSPLLGHLSFIYAAEFASEKFHRPQPRICMRLLTQTMFRSVRSSPRGSSILPLLCPD